jgi:hypothetical protein
MNGADAVTTQNLFISEQVQFSSTNIISTLQSNDNLIVSSASGLVRIDDISIKKTSTVGLTRLKYAGYADLDSQWFAGKTPVETTVLTAGVIQGVDSFTSPGSTTPFSFLYTGFFLAPTTATYTFTIFADEKAYIWLGNYATAGYTDVNANAYSDYFTSHTGTFSVALTAGQFYPIRLQWSNLGGPGDLTTFTWANNAGQATTADFTGRVFTEPSAAGVDTNTITNLTNGALTLTHTGTGYLTINDTNAFRIPFGTTAERTPVEVGATRWNSDIGYMECFDGTVWQVATGGGIVITAPIMEELGHVYTLIFG